MNIITTENIRNTLLQYCESDDVKQMTILFDKYLNQEQEVEMCKITNNFCQMCFQQLFMGAALKGSVNCFKYICSKIDTGPNFKIPQARYFHILRQSENNKIVEITISTIQVLKSVNQEDFKEEIESKSLPQKQLIEEILEVHSLRNNLKKELTLPIQFAEPIAKQKSKI